jgi:peroxiredoxin
VKTKYIGYAIIFLVGALGGNYLYKILTKQPEANAAAQAMVSKKVPEFTLPDLDGKTRNIREWDGSVIVLNFWATWCPPCRKETPMFVELQESLGERGLQFVGVAIDDAAKVQDFMDTYGVNYPMMIGSEDAIEVAKKYGNKFGALPYTVIIDRQGTIAHVTRGELKREVAERTIRSLL